MVTLSDFSVTSGIDGKLQGTVEFRGLSTDAKPVTDVINGASFIEIDTGDVYMFDAVAGDWNQI